MFIIKLVAESMARTAEIRRNRRAAAAAAAAAANQGQASTPDSEENGGAANNPDKQESSEDEGYLDFSGDSSLLDRVCSRNPMEDYIKNGASSILYNLVSKCEDMETAGLRSQLFKMSTEPTTDADEPVSPCQHSRRRKRRTPLRHSSADPSTDSSVEQGLGTSSSSTESVQSITVDDQVPSTSYGQRAPHTETSPVAATGDIGWQMLRRKRHRRILGSECRGNSISSEEPLDLSSSGLQQKLNAYCSQFPLLEQALFSTDDTVTTKFSAVSNAPVGPSTSRTNQPILRRLDKSGNHVRHNNDLCNGTRQVSNAGNSLKVPPLGSNIHDLANMWKFLLTPFGMATTIVTMLASKSAMPCGQTAPTSDAIGQTSEEPQPVVSFMSSLLTHNMQQLASHLSANNMAMNGTGTTQSMQPVACTCSNRNAHGLSSVANNGSTMDRGPDKMPAVNHVPNAYNGIFSTEPQVSNQGIGFQPPLQEASHWEANTQNTSHNGAVTISAGNGAMDTTQDNNEHIEMEGVNNTHTPFSNGNGIGQLLNHVNPNLHTPTANAPQASGSSDVTESQTLVSPVDYAINKVQFYLFSLTELIIQPKELLTNDLRKWKRSEQERVPQATVRTFATLMLQLMEVPVLNRLNLLKISWHRLLVLYLQEDDKAYAWFRQYISNTWRVERAGVKAVMEQLEEIHTLGLSLKRNPFVFQMLRVALLLLGEKDDFSGDPIVRQMEETLYQDSMQQNNHSPTAGVIPQVLVTAQYQLTELIKFRTCLRLLGNLDQEATGQLFRAVFKQPITVFSKVLRDFE